MEYSSSVIPKTSGTGKSLPCLVYNRNESKISKTNASVMAIDAMSCLTKILLVKNSFRLMYFFVFDTTKIV
jgi:hypothetical protein